MVVLFIVVYVAGFVEVAADGVEDEEEEGHDEDGQHHVDGCFTCVQTFILSAMQLNNTIQSPEGTLRGRIELSRRLLVLVGGGLLVVAMGHRGHALLLVMLGHGLLLVLALVN